MHRRTKLNERCMNKANRFHMSSVQTVVALGGAARWRWRHPAAPLVCVNDWCSGELSRLIYARRCKDWDKIVLLVLLSARQMTCDQPPVQMFRCLHDEISAWIVCAISVLHPRCWEWYIYTAAVRELCVWLQPEAISELFWCFNYVLSASWSMLRAYDIR